MTTNDRFRPQYHFTPPENWLNDPNGLVYYAGEYHLFYQHFPHAPRHGPMHWGHAVSRDLIHWTHLPIALYPDEHGTIFSGSAVIDWHNSAGFGKEAMVAIFTHHREEGHRQSQSIAYSLDRGRTWTKYAGNPVIPTPDHLRDFRDPKVDWYGTPEEGHWFMCLTAGRQILFYRSPNLIDWEASGSFGSGHGATDGVWETPDLFQLPVDEGAENRWVLLVGIWSGAPAGGSGTRYFVGRFDGNTFISEDPLETVLWADYGADDYAAQTWNGEPEGRRLMIGWMSNWEYASVLPTQSWRGAMTLPRELTLIRTSEGIRLRQQPVAAVTSLRRQKASWRKILIPADSTFTPEIAPNALWEIEAEFAVPSGQCGEVGIQLLFGQDARVTIGYTPHRNQLFFDRTEAGAAAFSESFAAVHRASLTPADQTLRLRLLVDRSSIELFANDGLVTMTECIFPAKAAVRLCVYAKGADAMLKRLEIFQLDSARMDDAVTQGSADSN